MSNAFLDIFRQGTSDIDLLVRPEDLDEAVALLERHEFIRYIEDDADHFHMLLNKFYANEDFPLLGVELHWNIFANMSRIRI